MSQPDQGDSHGWACICRGAGTVESGPAGATYSVPCPGPPQRIWRFGVTYERVKPKPKPKPCVRCGLPLDGGSVHGPGFCIARRASDQERRS